MQNLFLTEKEIPKYIDLETEKHGDILGGIMGITRGVNAVFARKIVGVLDILTAPTPFDIYVFNPEMPGAESSALEK